MNGEKIRGTRQKYEKLEEYREKVEIITNVGVSSKKDKKVKIGYLMN